MTKLNLFFNGLILSDKPQAWFKCLILAGLSLKLLAMSTPVALAQTAMFADFGQSILEAVQNPHLEMVKNSITKNFILSDNSFAQAMGSIDNNGNYLKAAEPKIAVQVIIPVVPAVVKETRAVIVTAYSSTPDQTDSTPFISANGTYVYDGMIACNFLPFGTKVRFPDVYGDKIFTVEDRMAWFNSHKIDVWMPDRQSALQFGVKRLAVEILE